MVGETRSKVFVARLAELGWGRMFVDRPPCPFPFERWGFDNQAFIAWRNGTEWNGDAYLKRLEAAMLANSDPYLAVTPDIVAAGLKSLHHSIDWRMNQLRDVDWPWYLAVQDGMTREDVKPYLHLFQGLFLGGSDAFKSTARRWADLSHDNGLKFHYGRAGTPGKLVSAFKSGCDSCDSAFPLWTKERMKIFAWRWQGLAEQKMMEFT
jgi:hypothetical protein